MGVNGLLGVKADGGPSRVVQPPLLKPDTDVIGGGREGGGGGEGEGGFCWLETLAHPGFLKPPPEDELFRVDQPPVVKLDFFSVGAGPGSVPWVGVEPRRGLCAMLVAGAAMLSFTPAALAAFRNSFSSLFLSFSLRFSTASWELALARWLDCISLNRIL